METNNLVKRSYSITCQDDFDQISNGRCPSYALNWGHEANKKHWVAGHDYFKGNNLKSDHSDIIRAILSDKFERGILPANGNILFCDLDGVLADFGKQVMNKFGKPVDEISPAILWSTINRSETFFESLPWMPKGRDLWEAIKQYHPIILTGIPNSKTAAEQKRKWCQRELGEDIQVITCKSIDKYKYCYDRGCILVDDRADNVNAWGKKGGISVLYDEINFEEIINNVHTIMATNNNSYYTEDDTDEV